MPLKVAEMESTHKIEAQLQCLFLVRFDEVGHSKMAYWSENGPFFLWTFGAGISRVLRVRRPEARRWNGHNLYFAILCLKIKNVEIKLVCAFHTFR